MQKLKFILLTTLILLSGAVLSGLAAWKVVAPNPGETVNAGVVAVPSVLGQTADELLFYPWPVYDMQTLSPLSEADLESYEIGSEFTAVAVMGALGAEYDMEAMIRSQVSNQKAGSFPRGSQIRYLKDFPAVLDSTPVLLNYAQSSYNSTAVSWLMEPAEEAELSETQQQEALDKVRDDLKDFLWNLPYYERDNENDLLEFFEDFNRWMIDCDVMFREWLQNWGELFYLQYGDGWDSSIAFEESPGIGTYDPGEAGGRGLDPCPYTLEELLAQGQAEFMDVQLISTPRQIVLLFSAYNWWTIGVYYDIQLGCYSGLGMSE